jgi:CRP-like cAMP-binding protein
MFGYMALTEDDFDFDTNLIKTSEMAEKIVEKEIQALISKSLNYGYVLNAIAYRMDRYSKIKKYVESNFSGISDPTLSKILSSLKKQSFIDIKYNKAQKSYVFPDPVIKKVCEEIAIG